MRPDLIVVGGGLAGCEAAWQAAEKGLSVRLYEMRPGRTTGAHQTAGLAELVCSNSLGSNLEDRPSGLLKWEVKRMGSLLVSCAEACAIPAGRALAVDRAAFSNMVTEKINLHKMIEVVHEETTSIPDGLTIIAAGPLVSPELAFAIGQFTGQENLFFYDAVAPIVTYESIDMNTAYWGSRYDSDKGGPGDYINCPMDEMQYKQFYESLIHAERTPLREFESEIPAGVSAGARRYFEACLPVETLAQRNPKSLTYGPLRPVGLTNPRTNRWPYAVVQLRRDNVAGTLFNIVGFQTNLKNGEQERVFRMIPGLENASFVRYGRMHRNTFIHSPRLLKPSLQTLKRDDLLFAGQITGIEGYLGSIATGLLAGKNAYRWIAGLEPLSLPKESMLGALCEYITSADDRDFQPMKANFGLLPELEGEPIRDARKRAQAYVRRAQEALGSCLMEIKDCA